MDLTKCCSGKQIGNNGMGGVCGTYGGQQSCIRGFGGETERRSPFMRPRCRQEDNIKMALQELEFGTDWNHLVQDRGKWRSLVSTVLNFWCP